MSSFIKDFISALNFPVMNLFVFFFKFCSNIIVWFSASSSVNDIKNIFFIVLFLQFAKILTMLYFNSSLFLYTKFVQLYGTSFAECFIFITMSSFIFGKIIHLFLANSVFNKSTKYLSFLSWKEQSSNFRKIPVGDWSIKSMTGWLSVNLIKPVLSESPSLVKSSISYWKKSFIYNFCNCSFV